MLKLYKRENFIVALVKEEYYINSKYTHEGYLLYKLVKYDDGFKIKEIIW